MDRWEIHIHRVLTLHCEVSLLGQAGDTVEVLLMCWSYLLKDSEITLL